MTADEQPRKYAVAGRCTACGVRVVRGFDDGGVLVNVGIFGSTAAQEQMARARRRGSFVLAWRGAGMTITRRSDDDVLLRPPSFRQGERVVVEHHCEGKGTE